MSILYLDRSSKVTVSCINEENEKFINHLNEKYEMILKDIKSSCEALED